MADLMCLLNPANELSVELVDRGQDEMMNEQAASIWGNVAETRALYASGQVEIAFQPSLRQTHSRKDPLVTPKPHLCLDR